jgi:hypothetical protein
MKLDWHEAASHQFAEFVIYEVAQVVITPTAAV